MSPTKNWIYYFTKEQPAQELYKSVDSESIMIYGAALIVSASTDKDGPDSCKTNPPRETKKLTPNTNATWLDTAKIINQIRKCHFDGKPFLKRLEELR